MTAEERVKELGLDLSGGPKPLGAYVESVQTGNLLFLTGMLPIADGKPVLVVRSGEKVDVEQGRAVARAAAMNVLAVARHHLGSLDRVTRMVRLTAFLVGVAEADQPKVADGASELFRDVFGPERMSVRSVIGVASLPLGMPVELEVTMEVS